MAGESKAGDYSTKFFSFFNYSEDKDQSFSTPAYRDRLDAVKKHLERQSGGNVRRYEDENGFPEPEQIEDDSPYGETVKGWIDKINGKDFHNPEAMDGELTRYDFGIGSDRKTVYVIDAYTGTGFAGDEELVELSADALNDENLQNDFKNFLDDLFDGSIF